MKTVKEVFKIVKLAPFAEKYLGMNAMGGLYHKVNGKSTNGKDRELSEQDKKDIKDGIRLLINDLQNISNSL